MTKENTWTPVQSFGMGTVKVGGDAIPIKEEEEKDDGNKQESNGKDSES